LPKIRPFHRDVTGDRYQIDALIPRREGVFNRVPKGVTAKRRVHMTINTHP
jgi:hypothetical protein